MCGLTVLLYCAAISARIFIIETDHHWKTGAAFDVYQEWAAVKNLTVPSAQDYQIETVTDSFEGTIQSKLGIHTVKDTIELYQPVEDLFYTVQMDGSDAGILQHLRSDSTGYEK